MLLLTRNLVEFFLQVTPYKQNDALFGFTVSFLKDGETATDVRVAFDDEITLKHEWVGRGAGLLPSEMIYFRVLRTCVDICILTQYSWMNADGFPMLEGNAEEVKGKNFEIRKLGDAPVSGPIKASIKEFCQMLVGAINKYYAFGSCFVDDST